MSSPAVRIEVTNRVWRVTLNRPQQGNACSAELVQALEDALAKAENEDAQAFVLQGEGRHFCTGFDVSQLESENDDTLLARFVRIELLLQRLARAPFLTVACAHGRAMGAGADLFSACELRLAEADSSFAFPGARGFGLVLGTRRLASRVGERTALAWVESACSVATEQAVRHGLVHEVVGSPQAVEDVLASQLHRDRWLRASSRIALAPQASLEDAHDLQMLVRSAARHGLRDRIATYVMRSATARRPSPSPATP